MNSCTYYDYNIFNATCDPETNIHSFVFSMSASNETDAVHIRLNSLEEGSPEEEHELPFVKFFTYEKEKMKQWALDLTYDGAGEQFEPNKTTLLSCDTPRSVKFIVSTGDSTYSINEVVFMHAEE